MEKKWALSISEDKHEGFCVLYVIVVANASSGEKEGKLFLKNLKFRMDSKNALFGFLTICFGRFVNSMAYYVWVKTLLRRSAMDSILQILTHFSPVIRLEYQKY